MFTRLLIVGVCMVSAMAVAHPHWPATRTIELCDSLAKKNKAKKNVYLRHDCSVLLRLAELEEQVADLKANTIKCRPVSPTNTPTPRGK